MDGWIGGMDDVLGGFIGLKIWKDLVAGLQFDNFYIGIAHVGKLWPVGWGTSGTRRYDLRDWWIIVFADRHHRSLESRL